MELEQFSMLCNTAITIARTACLTSFLNQLSFVAIFGGACFIGFRYIKKIIKLVKKEVGRK